jgi:hypothetical protein
MDITEISGSWHRQLAWAVTILNETVSGKIIAASALVDSAHRPGDLLQSGLYTVEVILGCGFHQFMK